MAPNEGLDRGDGSSATTNDNGYPLDSSSLKHKLDKMCEYLQETDTVPQQICEEVVSSAVTTAVESAMSGQDCGAIQKKVRRRISKALTKILSNKAILKRLTGRKSTRKIKKIIESLYKSYNELQMKLTSTVSMGKDQCESADLESRVCVLEKKALGLRGIDILAFKVLQEAEWPPLGPEKTPQNTDQGQSATDETIWSPMSLEKLKEKLKAEEMRHVNRMERAEQQYLDEGDACKQTVEKIRRRSDRPNGDTRWAYYRIFMLRIYDQAVISRLNDASDQDLLAMAHTSLQKVKSADHSAHDIRLFQTPTLMQSGDLKVFVHAQHRKGLRSLSKFAAWAQFLEKEVSIRVPSCRLVVHDIEVQSMEMNDEISKVRAVELLTSLNTGDGKPFNSPSDIRDLRWLTEYRDNQKMVLLVLEVVKREQANEILEKGIHWGGSNLRCEVFELDHLLTHCKHCQHYGHKAVSCPGPLRCERCSGPHGVLACHSAFARCPACAGPHDVQDPTCPVKLAIHNRMRQTQFGPEGDGVLCAPADRMLPPNITTNTFTIHDIKASLTRPPVPGPLPRRAPTFPVGNPHPISQQLRNITQSRPSEHEATPNIPKLDDHGPPMPALGESITAGPASEESANRLAERTTQVPGPARRTTLAPAVPLNQRFEPITGARSEESANRLAERITQVPGPAHRTTLAPAVPLNKLSGAPTNPRNHFPSKRRPQEAMTFEDSQDSRKKIKMEPTSSRSSSLSLYKF